MSKWKKTKRGYQRLYLLPRWQVTNLITLYEKVCEELEDPDHLRRMLTEAEIVFSGELISLRPDNSDAPKNMCFLYVYVSKP